LHPPQEEITIKILSAENLKSDLNEKNPFKDINKWGFIPFNVEESTMDNLRKFRIEWTLYIKNKRKQARKNLFSINTDSSDNESLLESDEEDSNKRIEKQMMRKTVNAVCLAAFAVLMKHISGRDKFLLGVPTNFRNPGLILGPLTDIYPIKIDLSKKNKSFSSLFTSIFRIFNQIKRHSFSCPSSVISEKFGVGPNFPIQFEFVTLAELNYYKTIGLSINDILSPQEIHEERFGSVLTEKLWSDNKNDQFDIRFVMVEHENGLECGVRFRKDRFDPEKIGKWITKFKSTLEGIDCNRRRVSVGDMISR
jgi:hypothetical protein